MQKDRRVIDVKAADVELVKNVIVDYAEPESSGERGVPKASV